MIELKKFNSLLNLNIVIYTCKLIYDAYALS